LAILFAAFLLFMWMYLASEGLERTAAGDGRAEVAAAAAEYSYLWRHGMVGGWPLFVPGFFAVAVATAVWAAGRAMLAVVLEGAGALLGATLVAKLLAPLGTDRLLPAFEAHAAVTIRAERLEATWSGALLGMLTVTSWAALIVAGQVALARRSVRPALVPLALYVALASLRPGALGDLLLPWGRRLVEGDWVAALSTALIPVLAVALWRYGRRRVPGVAAGGTVVGDDEAAREFDAASIA
jgi:hypothetical protein